METPEKTFVRDQNSKAILSHDMNGLEAYKKRKMIEAQKSNDINILKEKIVELEKRIFFLENK